MDDIYEVEAFLCQRASEIASGATMPATAPEELRQVPRNCLLKDNIAMMVSVKMSMMMPMTMPVVMAMTVVMTVPKTMRMTISMMMSSIVPAQCRFCRILRAVQGPCMQLILAACSSSHIWSWP